MAGPKGKKKFPSTSRTGFGSLKRGKRRSSKQKGTREDIREERFMPKGSAGFLSGQKKIKV